MDTEALWCVLVRDKYHQPCPPWRCNLCNSFAKHFIDSCVLQLTCLRFSTVKGRVDGLKSGGVSLMWCLPCHCCLNFCPTFLKFGNCFQRFLMRFLHNGHYYWRWFANLFRSNYWWRSPLPYVCSPGPPATLFLCSTWLPLGLKQMDDTPLSFLCDDYSLGQVDNSSTSALTRLTTSFFIVVHFSRNLLSYITQYLQQELTISDVRRALRFRTEFKFHAM